MAENLLLTIEEVLDQLPDTPLKEKVRNFKNGKNVVQQKRGITDLIEQAPEDDREQLLNDCQTVLRFKSQYILIQTQLSRLQRRLLLITNE